MRATGNRGSMFGSVGLKIRADRNTYRGDDGMKYDARHIWIAGVIGYAIGVLVCFACSL